MHIGAVSIFEGPPPPFDELARDGRRQARPRPPLPPEGPLRAARRRARPCGSTTRTSASTTTSATARSPSPGERGAAAPDGGAHLLPAPRPQQAAVGVVGDRGPEGQTLGAALEGPSLHGRRCRRDRPDVRHVLRRLRRLGCRGEWSARTRALRPRDARAHDRPARQPRRPARSAATDGRSRLAKRCASLGKSARAAAAATPQHAARRRVLADRPDRTAPPLELGRGAPVRHQGRPQRARRHRQRRRADAHH